MGGEGTGNNLLSDTANKESWNVVKILRGHLEDVYDLCWSCDSLNIITGSVDNSAIIWDVQNGMHHIIQATTILEIIFKQDSFHTSHHLQRTIWSRITNSCNMTADLLIPYVTS